MWGKRIEELKEQIEELKAQWPAHSVSPGLLEQLDELETELEGLLSEYREAETDA